MIKIIKNQSYDKDRFPHKIIIRRDNGYCNYVDLSPKELEQLFKKVGKILGKGKDYCVYCKADLK